MRVFLAAILATLFVAGPALADDSALNKEGRWTVGRGEADSKTCMASITIGDSAMLVIQAAAGDRIDFAVGTEKPMRKGKQGVFVVGDQRFDFQPTYGDKRDLMFLENVSGRALATMRTARWIGVMVDGREVVALDLDKTGVEGALDAVVACSKGESGWWGPGVGVAAAADGDGPGPLHKDGVWQLSAGEGPGICFASANVGDTHTFTVIAQAGLMAFGVGSDADMRRGRKGRLQTDAFGFDFKPTYENPNFFYSEDLDSQSTFALRRARTVAVSIDGKALIDIDLEGTGYADVMNDLQACSAGEKGWWGEGAKQP